MNIRFRNVNLVAMREVKTIVCTKGFLLVVFLPLFILFIMMAIMPLAEKLMTRPTQDRTTPVRIGVITSNPALVEAWNLALNSHKLSNGQPLFDLTPISLLGFPEETVEANAQKKVRTKEWDAYAVLSGDITEHGSCDVHTLRGFHMVMLHDLNRGLRDVVRQERLKKEGLDPDRIEYLTRGVTWNEYELTPESAVEGGAKRKMSFDRLFAPALVCVMMMFFLTFTTSQRLLRGVVEEKTSRVVEVLLSSLSPSEILSGKVLGFYLLGLIQFALWVGIGMVLFKVRGISVGDLIPPMYFLNFMIFLTTGYLFFASMFAAIGAMVGDETESQQLQGMFVLPIILPLMFNFVIITQPNWWIIRLISFIPIFTPAVMALRLIAAPIPWWEITLVAISTLIFALLGIWAAARIFRVGILMTGKRPALKEIWRWCLYRDVSGVMES
ncbi:MAG: ABC transporter permease [bacterium]